MQADYAHIMQVMIMQRIPHRACGQTTYVQCVTLIMSCYVQFK